jgi:hypothetical protein
MERNADLRQSSLAAKTGATFGRAVSTEYRETFFAANPDLEGQVVVHHAVEQHGILGSYRKQKSTRWRISAVFPRLLHELTIEVCSKTCSKSSK